MIISPLRFGLLGVAAGVTLLAVQPATAASDADGQLLPNTDVRDGQKVAQVAPKAAERLDRKLGAQGFVDPNPQTGAASFVGRTDGYLTPRSDATPRAIVKGYVSDNRAAFGLDDSDLAGLQLTDSYTSVDGVTHVTYAQKYKGLESFDTYLRGNVTEDGRLINVSGSPQPDLSVASITPSLSADEALLAARDDVGGDDTVPPVKNRSSAPDQKTTYDTYAESARLVIFAQAGGDRLAWEVQVLDKDSILYLVVVDADSGDILVRQSMTAFDSNDAQVWPYFPSQLVAPTQVNFGTDPSWLDRSAANGNQLIGNNTHTYVDSNGTNGYQAGEEVVRNPGTTNWKYPMTWFTQSPECPAFGCTWNSTNNATKTTNRNPGAVGLFYLTNHFHDHLLAAPIGFNEASRNFEFVNSTGQGVGNDAVLAEAQDSSGLNNANFTTPPDGTAPRMQMFMWSGSGPVASGPQYDVDGSASADVVYHEYAHGLSNRLVGNGGGLTALQSGAMGEGWSDFYAMDLLVAEGQQADNAGSPDVWLGEYATGVPGIFGGVSRIRHQAIDCPVGSASPNCPASGTAGSGGYTYGDLGKVGTVNGVHDGGEIWSQTLWDLRKTLGRTNALKIITGGMRLSPNAPSYLTMRDAILQSAQVNGVNMSTVWSVFANRGMGFLATTPSANANSATEDFTLPPKLLFVSTSVNDNAPRGDGDGVAEPGETLSVATTLQNLTGGTLTATGTLTSSAGTVNRGSSNWSIGAGASGANSPTFAVTLAENQQCGVPVDLTVSVTGPDGPVTVPVKSVVTGSPSFNESTDVPKSIPDNNAAGVNSTFTFPGAGTAQGLIVKIGRINHTWVGDLKITLTHGAKTVVLVNRIGGGTNGLDADNLVNLILDDGASGPVDAATFNGGVGGVTGTYRPEQALSAFNGDSLSGVWTLNVSDLVGTDTGTLQQWGPGVRVCDTFGQPSSTTSAASAIGPDTATVNGEHTSKGKATDYRFEWGTTTSYGQTTPITAGGTANVPVPVSAVLTGLTPSTTYHFRLIALRDGVVLSKGADQQFTTAAVPPATPPSDPPATPPSDPPVVTKDSSVPQVTITKAPKKVKTKKAKAKVTVQFTSEAGATFTCKVDKRAAAACTSPFTTSVKAKRGKGKAHVIVIVAKDVAGNVSAPATVAFKAVRKR